MDRVDIKEKPGCATYYMGQAPEEYGYRIFDMAEHKEAEIHEILMDIGKNRSRPWQTITSENQFRDIVRDSKEMTIYSVSFDLAFKGLKLQIFLDFQMKRFRLKVNPHLSIDEKKLLAEFVDILHTEDYYVIKENEELDKEIDFSKIKLIKKRHGH